jgi:acetylornithine deacetylase/succinyl-diaminopimelate desuccinylase-like protein
MASSLRSSPGRARADALTGSERSGRARRRGAGALAPPAIAEPGADMTTSDTGRPPVAVDAAELVDLAARLVRIPSHPGVPRREEGVARELAAYLAGHGIAAEPVEVAPGRPNLLAALEAGEPGRRLLLCGHTDTVPLNAGQPGVGLSGEVRDGRLHGRGAVDMKGALAAMAAALVALRRGGALAAGAVTLAAVVDEEMAGLGAEHLVAGWLAGRAAGGSARGSAAPDAAIVGEPTGNRPCLGHKGLEWLEVTFTGRAAHGGTPERGVNAIAAAARFVHLVETDLAPRLAARAHPLLGPPTINFGTVAGGDQPSTVAARCALALDRRLVPGESCGSAVAELTELLARVEAAMPGLSTAVRRLPGGAGALERRAFATPSDAPIARAVAAARRAVGTADGAGGAEVARGPDGAAAPRAEEAAAGPPGPAFGAFPAWTDGGLFAGHAGVPTVILGPGDLALAHSPGEAVAVAELVEAARLYAAAALAFCPPEEEGS